MVSVGPRYRIYIIVGVSILLHILLLFLWEGAIRLRIFGYDIIPRPLESEPIVFDLQQPDLPKEVIETPEDAKTVEKQDKADFLSDKNALARNQESDPKLEEGAPFARGVFDSHDLPAQKGTIGEQAKPQPRDQEQDQRDRPNEYSFEVDAGEIIKDYLQKQKPEKPGVKERLPGVPHENLESQALEKGGLSFNTYNWDFAPYMLMLKDRIRHNIYPPPAFSLLGMISGETLLRFKIYPDGTMKDLEILGYKGHESLMQTSYNAVDVSAPFPKLPKDFPEDYLEVTGKFIYFIQKYQ